MDHHVIGALHERRVDVAEGNQPLFGQSGREGDCMTFGNAHVKGPFGELFHQIGHRTAGRHGRCHPDNALILFCQFDQSVSEHILIELRLVQFVDDDPFAGFLVELARSMPFCG